MIDWLIIGGAVVAMYAATKPRNGYLPRDAKTKICAFAVVVAIVGFLLLSKITNWKSTFWETTVPVMETPQSEQPGQISRAVNAIQKGQEQLQTQDKQSTQGNDIFYGIMFDAGSTGSRVHAMKFQATSPGKPFKLLDVLFKQMKPGLSSYGKDPAQGAASLKPLLDDAFLYIPADQHASVPIALKATAGLRLLPKEQSSALLSEVTKLFKQYPFRVFNDSVGIMEGTDEGIFSWFTLNFFMGTMQSVKSTVGVMDLGGGSTQVTFVPQQESTLKEVSKDRLTEIDILGGKHQLYTHSYLGLGLKSARLQILGGQEGDGGKALESICVTAGANIPWNHGGNEYKIKGLPDPGNRYQVCYEAARKLVQGKIEKVREIQEANFCTISYYYDRAVEFGLIEQKHEGANLTVEQFFQAAEKECAHPHESEGFLCVDLAYISALLYDGFGFHKDTKLLVIKRVHGHEISWALGAMFNYFNIHSIRTR